MANVFKASRIKITGLTIDLDTPIDNKVFYETTRRMDLEEALLALNDNGNISIPGIIKRHRIREDSLIRFLRKLGSIHEYLLT